MFLMMTSKIDFQTYKSKIFPNKLTKEELSNIKSILQGYFALQFAKYPLYEFQTKSF